MPGSCRPYQQFNRYHRRWHHRAYRRRGTGRKHLLQQCQLTVRQETTMARAGTSRHTSIGEKFSRSNRSASNALTSRRSSKKTAGNKTKRKMEYWSTIPRVMMTFHLWNERLIFTSEEIPASEEVFASTEELCSVNFS